MWVDTHCHLQISDGDPAELLGRAPDVDWLVNPGVDLETSRQAVELAAEFPERVLAAVGLHPHDASEWAEQRNGLVALMESAVAVGETGLDFYRDHSPRDVQIVAFKDQLSIATEMDLPIVVHCRDAFRDVCEILDESNEGARAVLHCWTGGRKWTRRFLELGVTFSFAGPIAFSTGETIRLAAELVPSNRALVETDTPYLAPPPHRGQANEPAHVALVGAALAEVWGVDIEEVARATSENARRIFRA